MLVAIIAMIAIAGPMIARWGKSEQRMKYVVMLQGVNVLIVLCSFCIVLNQVGSHYNVSEKYVVNFFIALGIIQGLILLMFYLEYKKFKLARWVQELKKEQDMQQ